MSSPPSIHPSIASSSIHLSAMLTHMLTTQSGSTDNRRVKTNELCLTIFPPPPTPFSSPLKCLLFRQGEKRYRSPRGDKVSDLLHEEEKKNKNIKQTTRRGGEENLLLLSLELSESRTQSICSSWACRTAWSCPPQKKLYDPVNILQPPPQ